jgi:hypothetical protein
MDNDISEWLDNYADATGEALYLMEPRDLYNTAIVGIAAGVVVYDRFKVLELLQFTSEMDYEDALEYHYFNQDATEMWLFLDRPDNEKQLTPICDPSLN